MSKAENLTCGGALCGSEAALHPFWQEKLKGTGGACWWGGTRWDMPMQEVTLHHNCCVPWQPEHIPVGCLA
eukprot:851000-Pelagomonas_calceolata.AAC.2